MKPIENWNDIKPYTATERLPAGGYIIRILQATEESTQYGNKLVINFDIEEGEHKSFYAANYSSQTEPKKWKGFIRVNLDGQDAEQTEKAERKFRTIIKWLEDANPGFHWDWDEKKLKNKLIGCMFRNKEYDYNGSRGFWTEPCWLESVEKIRSGKFEIPADKLLPGSTTSSASANSFAEDDSDGDLPWKY